MWRRAVDELLMLPRDKKNTRERRGGFAGRGAFLAGVALHALLKGTLAVAGRRTAGTALEKQNQRKMAVTFTAALLPVQLYFSDLIFSCSYQQDCSRY